MLARRLGLVDVLAIGVNATVGSGVFALPDDLHRAAGGWSPLTYVLCTLLLLPVALCFAELAGRHEESGGAYLYAHRAFGARVGFFIGWFCWLNTFVSWAANTTLLVELTGIESPVLRKVFSAAAILGLGAVNYVGVRPGAFVVRAVVVGKLLAIACFLAVAVGFLHAGRIGGALPHGVLGLGQGIYLALFPLQGFEVAPITAGETDNPRRNVPLATVGSLVLSSLLFVAIQAVLVSSYARLGDPSETPLVDAARAIAPRLGLVVLLGSFVSMGGFTAGSALGSPRYAQAIADHGLFPKAFARIHPRFQTPHVAIVVTTLLTTALAMTLDYRRLVGMSNITVVVQYAAACLAVPVLRSKVGRSTGFIIPGGRLAPWLGTIGSIALLVLALGPGLLHGETQAWVEVAFALGAVATGGVLERALASR